MAISPANALGVAQDESTAPLSQLSWYEIDASIISDDARKLLENWSEIPPDEVNEHVDDVVSATACESQLSLTRTQRRKAFKIVRLSI